MACLHNTHYFILRGDPLYCGDHLGFIADIILQPLYVGFEIRTARLFVSQLIEKYADPLGMYICFRVKNVCEAAIVPCIGV